MSLEPVQEWNEALSREILSAAMQLRSGRVIAYPTETVWGLAAHPSSEEGLQRLRQLKERREHQAFQLSCASVDVARSLLSPSLEVDRILFLLPGPVSVVAPAQGALACAFALQGRVGVRVPNHPIALALLRAAGGVLVTTSCNRSGGRAAETFDEAVESGLADCVLPDGGVPSLGVSSTVVQLPDGLILREGAVPAQRIADLLEEALES